MDDRVDGIVGKDPLHGLPVAEVHLHQRNVFPSGDLFHALETGAVAVGEIVGDHHVVARLDEFHGHVASDEAGPAGYKHSLFHFHSV